MTRTVCKVIFPISPEPFLPYTIPKRQIHSLIFGAHLLKKGAFMISYKISRLKDFMSKLLTTDCFDSFLLEQAVITTYNTFTIDGHMEKEFYTQEEWQDAALRPYDFSCWSDVRPFCFSLIKGKKTPVSMKFILHLKPEKMQEILSENEVSIPADYIRAFVLTIRYSINGMSCTTGVSYSDFLLDKTADHLWDKRFSQFLDENDISYQL